MHPIALLALSLLPLAAPQKGGPAERGFTAFSTVLELGGEQQPLVGFQGTTIRYGSAIARSADSKSKAGRSFDDVTVELPLNPDVAAQKWLADAVAGEGRTQDLRVLEVDRAGGGAFVHSLSAAQFRSMTLSPIDGNGREAPTWTVALAVTNVDWKQDDSVVPKAIGKTKKADIAGFRFAIEGLDSSAVTSVGALRLDFFPNNSAGAKLAAPKVAPVRVAIAQRGVKAWLEWLGAKASAPTTATLELLDITGKEVLARVRLEGLTVAAQTRPGHGSDADSNSNIGLEVEFQCSALRIEPLKK